MARALLTETMFIIDCLFLVTCKLVYEIQNKSKNLYGVPFQKVVLI
jgi:hypothetical protein